MALTPIHQLPGVRSNFDIRVRYSLRRRNYFATRDDWQVVTFFRGWDLVVMPSRRQRENLRSHIKNMELTCSEGHSLDIQAP